MFNPFNEKTTRPIDSAALDQDAFDYNFKDHWIPIVAASVVLRVRSDYRRRNSPHFELMLSGTV